VDETVAHTAPTLTLRADSGLQQGLNDESMGISDVQIWLR
jgi:hypothetical protein